MLRTLRKLTQDGKMNHKLWHRRFLETRNIECFWHNSECKGIYSKKFLKERKETWKSLENKTLKMSLPLRFLLCLNCSFSHQEIWWFLSSVYLWWYLRLPLLSKVIQYITLETKTLPFSVICKLTWSRQTPSEVLCMLCFFFLLQQEKPFF